MMAVGMLPQRMVQLRFMRPCLRSDICGVTISANCVLRRWADIDKPGVLVGVQAGIFMVPVMGAALKQAQMVVVRPPVTRERKLEAGRVDVFMTDSPLQPTSARHRRLGRTGGTGLGLAICARMGAAHGGSIRAENMPDGGSRFHIRLPPRVAGETRPAEVTR